MSNESVSEDQLVLLERDGSLASLVLNRPARRNALTGPLADQMLAAIRSLNEDDGVSVIVVRGAGGAFCSGLDLKEFGREPQPDWVPDFGLVWREVHLALFDSPKIIVAALEKAAVNGGAALALAADFLVAGDQSFLQVGEIQQGMPAPMNVAWLSLRHSEATVARVALLGDRIHGAELVRLGLAHMTVPDDAVVQAATELAKRLAGHDSGGIRRIKRALRAAGPSSAKGSQWFDRATSEDNLGRVVRPIAARDD